MPPQTWNSKLVNESKKKHGVFLESKLWVPVLFLSSHWDQLGWLVIKAMALRDPQESPFYPWYPDQLNRYSTRQPHLSPLLFIAKRVHHLLEPSHYQVSLGFQICRQIFEAEILSLNTRWTDHEVISDVCLWWRPEPNTVLSFFTPLFIVSQTCTEGLFKCILVWWRQQCVSVVWWSQLMAV